MSSVLYKKGEKSFSGNRERFNSKKGSGMVYNISYTILHVTTCYIGNVLQLHGIPYFKITFQTHHNLTPHFHQGDIA